MEDKQEQLVTELEEIVKQLREGKGESAAALTSELSALRMQLKNTPRATFAQRIKQRVKRTLITLLVVVAAVGGVGGWLTYSKTVKHETQTIVTGVQALAKLATAEAYVTTTIEGEDRKLFGIDISVNLPGTKRVYFLIVPAKLLAGVDLKQVTADDVKVDPINKKVSVKLPHAAFIQEAVQVEQVKVFTDEGLFRSPITAKEGLALVSEAKVLEQLHKEADDMGILKTAEENAVKTIEGVYGNLGYQVEVTFE